MEQISDLPTSLFFRFFFSVGEEERKKNTAQMLNCNNFYHYSDHERTLIFIMTQRSARARFFRPGLARRKEKNFGQGPARPNREIEI